MKIWLLPTLLLVSSAKVYEEESADLYSKDGPVAHFDLSNFKTLLLGKRHAWVVEFYNGWCYQCQSLAPLWLRTAQEVAGWYPAVRVGAINCMRYDHLALCRNYGVSRFPRFKFFGPMTREGDVGVTKNKTDNPADMLDLIADHVAKIQREQHPPTWPDLEPFRGSLSEFLASPEPMHALVVEGSAGGDVGRQVVLDLSGHRQRLRLARAVLPPAGLHLTEKARPVLVTFRAGQRQPDLVSRDGLPPRKLFTDALRRALNITDAPKPGAQETAPSSTGPPVGEEMEVSVGDAVYMVDLENAVTYALRQEVSGKPDISGESLSALRNFVDTLIKHLPVRKSVTDALVELQTFLQARSSVGGAALEHHLDTALHQLPARRRWYGCRGSQPRYRGYPCGLWSVFHTLTVSAYQAEPNGNGSVLPAIHGYVKHFFSCEYCSQHFQEMSAEHGLFNITNAIDAVMWLWDAHNEVNDRLAGGPTEDPKHPKGIFPTRAQCRPCFDLTARHMVLSFLSGFYGRDAMKLDGLTNSESERPPTDPIQPVSGQLSDWRTSPDASHPIPVITTSSCGLLSSFGVLSCTFYLAVYCVLYLTYHRIRTTVTWRRNIRSRYSQKLPPV